MPKRNWTTIAQLADERTRTAVSLARDPDLLACYAKGFPHLFTDGDDEGPFCIPLSILMAAAYEYSRRENSHRGQREWEHDSHFSLGAAARQNSDVVIPSAFKWCAYDCPDEALDAELAPILDQFVGQKAQAGILISYKGKQCMVYNIIFTEDELELGSIFKTPPAIDFLDLVEVDFIDLDR